MVKKDFQILSVDEGGLYSLKLGDKFSFSSGVDKQTLERLLAALRICEESHRVKLDGSQRDNTGYRLEKYSLLIALKEILEVLYQQTGEEAKINLLLKELRYFFLTEE